MKQDILLERVLELWVATHILVDTELTWKTYYNPTLPPNSLHSLSQPSDEGRLPIEEVSDPESYGLLCSQLRSAMEKRAMALSKFVINDLERRLLQRQKCGWFDTFITAIILLNCVERTCWLFRSWDNENFSGRVSCYYYIPMRPLLTHFPVASGQASSLLLQPVRPLRRHLGDASAHAPHSSQGHFPSRQRHPEGRGR
jgi:hypothetical protein